MKTRFSTNFDPSAVVARRYTTRADDDGGGGGTGGTDDTGGSGGGGDGGDAWRDALPEDVRTWQETTDSKDPEGFWKTLSDMRSRMGNSLTLPTEEATPEVHQAFHDRIIEKVPNLMMKPNPDDADAMNNHYTAMGKPNEHGGYSLPEGLEPEGDVKTLFDDIRPIAHKANLTQGQFADMMEGFLTVATTFSKTQDGNQATQITGLRETWGAAYDQKRTSAIAIAEATHAPASLVDALKGDKAGADTYVWLDGLMASLGSEGNEISLQHGGDSSVMTPADAEQRIADIMKNDDYWDAGAQDHQRLVLRVAELQKFATPGASSDIRDLMSSRAS